MSGEFGESIPMNEVGPAEKDPTFEEGLEITFNKIKELLKKQDYVVVAINGSGHNVGKTRFTGELSKKLKSEESQVPTVNAPNSGHLDIRMGSLKDFQDSLNSSKGVIILDAHEYKPAPEKAIEDLKRLKNIQLKENAEKIGLPVEKIDIWIDISTPEKPFKKDEKNTDQMGDIIINNEGAVEK